MHKIFLQILLLIVLACSTSYVLSVEDVSQILTKWIGHISIMVVFVFAIALFTGSVLTFQGVTSIIAIAKSSQQGYMQGMTARTFSYIIAGLLLIFLPTVIAVYSISTFSDAKSSAQIMQDKTLDF